MKNIFLYSSLITVCGCSSVLGIGGYGVGDALSDGETSDGGLDVAEDGATESGVDVADTATNSTDTRDTRVVDAVVDAPEAATDSAKDTIADTRDVYCSSVTF